MNRFDCINSKENRFKLFSFDLEHNKSVVPNIVDPLCVDLTTDSNGNVIGVAYSSDISLLFNQQRLENVLGRDGVKKFFDSFAHRSSSLSQLRSKVSDDDLASMCKSRYLQSPSEILAWSDFLNSNYQTLLDSVKSRSEDISPSDTAPSDTAPTPSD